MPVFSYYNAVVSEFLSTDTDTVIGRLSLANRHSLEEPQRWAWRRQIDVLRSALAEYPDARLFLEFVIPRMGKRADAVLLTDCAVFVLEFKVGANTHAASALDQVEDYALDLKNFHEGSHSVSIIPLLISTDADPTPLEPIFFAADLVAKPIATNADNLGSVIAHGLVETPKFAIDVARWMEAGYRPTPTIIEAARVLYETHSVVDIARSDASAINLAETSSCANRVIDEARQQRKKTICFVTGVPGSGKTLAGLGMATQRFMAHEDEHAVFLSGNGPLVDVLREALARDMANRENVPKSKAEREVRIFIQNIHHFRDEYLSKEGIPVEKVVVFDEAQRAWTREQASNFMQRKRGQTEFDMSEPEFLIRVMDRHPDWCTVICLIGGGQEINTGEAGISEWVHALETHFPHWHVFISPRIVSKEYGASFDVPSFLALPQTHQEEHLHLSVSMRSFRAEALSTFVGHVVDNEAKEAAQLYQSIRTNYPLYVTRDLAVARNWLRERARGSERIGLVASSGAQRLRPEGIHVKAAIDPPNWFLNSATDVRSSCFLEEVASEFAVQGLELDWTGVCWDGDFYHSSGEWHFQSFKGTKWQFVKDESRRLYLRNAYRVLLTRARQGMVIFVPYGSESDLTRPSKFYDGTFEFLRECGIPVV